MMTEKERYQIRRPQMLAQKRAYYHAHPARHKENVLAWRALNKEAAINVLTNGEGTCRWCGQGDIDVLCFDHVNQDGAAHRKQVGNSSMAWWLIQHDYPEGFQVLCYNCNIKKHILYGREKSRHAA